MVIKISSFLFILFCFVSTVIGQPESKSPLKYSVEVVKLDKSKSELEVKLILKNVSKNKIVVHEKLLVYMTVFSKEPKLRPDGNHSNGVAKTRIAEIMPKDYDCEDLVALYPKKELVITRFFNLSSEFFEKDRGYSLQLTYGQYGNVIHKGLSVWRGTVDSKEVKFNL